MNPVETLFRHLDQWRHLPAYQLERRADVLFSIYMKAVVEEVTETPLEDTIIPEFPIKHGGRNQSDKVDYVLFAKDRSRVFFVELKTDAGSRRKAQDEYLRRAKEAGFRHAVEGVRAIMLSTKESRKYHHLADALARLKYLTLPDKLVDHTYPKPRTGLTKLLAEVVVAPTESAIEILYVQPKASEGERCIDFEQFAAHVAKHADPLSARFATALLEWRSAAGSRPPL